MNDRHCLVDGAEVGAMAQIELCKRCAAAFSGLVAYRKKKGLNAIGLHDWVARRKAGLGGGKKPKAGAPTVRTPTPASAKSVEERLLDSYINGIMWEEIPLAGKRRLVEVAMEYDGAE